MLVAGCVFRDGQNKISHPAWSSYNVTFTFLPSRSSGVYIPSSWIWVGLWHCENNAMWLLKVDHKRWYNFHLVFLEESLLESNHRAVKKPKLHEESDAGVPADGPRSRPAASSSLQVSERGTLQDDSSPSCHLTATLGEIHLAEPSQPTEPWEIMIQLLMLLWASKF